MKYLLRTCQIFLVLSIVFPSISAAEKSSKEKDNNLPIEITSDKMTSDQKSNEIIFTGKVVAKRGKLIIFSDKMIVYNSKNDKGAITKGTIEKIVAKGNVKMEKEGRVATGKQAVYFKNEGKIILTGNPVAWEKNNKIIGTKMIFWVDENKFVVEGSKDKRMKFKFYPEKKEKK